MDLVTPGIGLIFWSTLIFLLLLIVLKKYAWKPVLNAVKGREERIKSALESAEEAREEMAKLKADNEVILKEAKEERNNLIQEARSIKIKMIDDAKVLANEEANKIIETARVKINSEKEAAIMDLRRQVAEFSVEIAEKILKKKLEDTKEQRSLIERSLDDLKLN
jgi:F-type H+-transporting ATPase subunit b